jgi:hypothetical protein
MTCFKKKIVVNKGKYFNFYKKIHTKQQYQLQAFKVETTFNSIVVLYYNIISFSFFSCCNRKTFNQSDHSISFTSMITEVEKIWGFFQYDYC